MRSRSRAGLWPCLGTLALAACAGSGVGLDANGRPLNSGGGGNTPLTADFQSIQDHVFTPICSVCHAGGGAPQGLRLDAQNSYALLVGVPSTEVPALLRVQPGDPDNSYIIQKVEGHAAVGARMPLGQPALPAATIAVLRQWITDGALRAAAATPQQAFAIAAAVPAMQDGVEEAPARLVVEFTRELDQTRVDATTLRLERLDTGAGEAAGPGESWTSLPADFAVPAANAFALIATPRAALTPGTYRLIATGSPGPMLSDLAGQPLPADASAGTVITRFDVEPTP